MVKESYYRWRLDPEYDCQIAQTKFGQVFLRRGGTFFTIDGRCPFGTDNLNGDSKCRFYTGVIMKKPSWNATELVDRCDIPKMVRGTPIEPM